MKLTLYNDAGEGLEEVQTHGDPDDESIWEKVHIGVLTKLDIHDPEQSAIIDFFAHVLETIQDDRDMPDKDTGVITDNDEQEECVVCGMKQDKVLLDADMICEECIAEQEEEENEDE